MKKIIIGIVIILIIIINIFMYFGGFSTGDSLNLDEFKNYAKEITDFTIPEDSKIIAFGEASHGNKEFQELKLEIFKKLVEKYNVKAFALEADFGGCLEINDYIHGAKGNPLDVISKAGFKIYQTEQMIEIIEYMRKYNANHQDDLRFYGFDMQRTSYSLKALNLDSLDNEKLLALKENDDELIKQYATVLLQNIDINNSDNGSLLRDKYMAENVEWILRQEEKKGYQTIFITGHNEHVAKWESYDSMGKWLSKEDNGYYVIGTDFYKSKCNLPAKNKRIVKTFYSHDPLAKTLNLSGLSKAYIDFSKVDKDSEIFHALDDYQYMGSLGERYSFIMRLLPMSYRIYQRADILYDAMILIDEVTPIKILD